ncbi:hypothetical protein KFZ56_00135 [Virgibacillus sp. NKC19-3]|uniref:hypothetical protein n=1 Tax=Virgibacillus saliphilus TaxID=2831674 RepID=UPI001C9A9C5C|nr:hypothetical protein [Virgibacillus sp. NKC19-3]MBY7141540.1 hypothetical protein [Virgibacillus sp. NKC19-3]
MNKQQQTKGFGEILDAAFRLCKNHFSDFFKIVLILIGPIYLLQAIILLLSGTSFFREMGSGSSRFDQIFSSVEASANTTLGEDLANIVVTFPMLILYPVALAAGLFAINQLNKGQEFTVKSVIKQAFSKFWQILGSSLLFGVIFFGMVFVPTIIITIFGVIGTMAAPVAGIIMMIILFLGLGFTVFFFMSRWSLYLGATVFDDNMPGLARSWRLTRKQVWKVLGIYLVLSLIFFIISVAIESIFIMLLGTSVLYTLIINLVTLFTSMVFMVGYAILYFDLKTRHDGDDLNEMIDDYQTPGN